MMRRNIKFNPITPGLPMNTHNLHLFLSLIFVLFFFILVIALFIIFQLSLQPRNNILYTKLPFLKRKIPAPIPPSRLFVRF